MRSHINTTITALRECGRDDLARDYARLMRRKHGFTFTNPVKIILTALALWAVIGVLVWMLLQGRA